jgi:dipeptidyl aminopeptidase/acylaminoacyl peptidase
LHVAPVVGGGEVRQVASWRERVDALEWSPDGTRLAFGARQVDEERKGKEPKDQPPRRLTRIFNRVDSVGWLVDRPRHLFVVPADGGARPRQVTTGEAGVDGLAWAPDGTELVCAGYADDEAWDLELITDLWAVPLAGGDRRRVTASDRQWSRPSVSPDGRHIAAVDDGDPWQIVSPGVAVVDAATGAVTPLTVTLDRPCLAMVPDSPVWVGDRLVFSVEDRGDTHLFRVAADGTGAVDRLIQGERGVYAFDAVGDVLAFSASSPDALAEVFVVVGGEERQLTALGAAFADNVATSRPIPFTATSADGTEVPAWYVPPIGATAGDRRPLLLNVHGGPFAQYGNKFFDEFQMQAGAGYGVVFCNPRGSSGYGDAWGRAICWPQHPHHPGSGWGGVDADDVMAALDEACQRFDTVDAERVGVMGGSYGGYMTSWLIGHGDRFRAACSERAVNDLVSLEEMSDIASWLRDYTGVSHVAAPAALVERSPLTYVEDINTPLLIVHSEGDLRCPIGQADALFTALRLLRRPVEMLRFPAESHELSRSGSPKHRVQRMEAILEWFDTHLR